MSQGYVCEMCDEHDKQERNCRNEYDSVFRFQIQSIQDDNIDDCYINECPRGFVSTFSTGMWGKYQDMLCKKELGMKTERMRGLHFQAIRTLMFAVQDFEEVERERKERSGK